MTETINPEAYRYAVREADKSGLPRKCILWDILWQKAYYEYLEKLNR